MVRNTAVGCGLLDRLSCIPGHVENRKRLNGNSEKMMAGPIFYKGPLVKSSEGLGRFDAMSYSRDIQKAKGSQWGRSH